MDTRATFVVMEYNEDYGDFMFTTPKGKRGECVSYRRYAKNLLTQLVKDKDIYEAHDIVKDYIQTILSSDISRSRKKGYAMLTIQRVFTDILDEINAIIDTDERKLLYETHKMDEDFKACTTPYREAQSRNYDRHRNSGAGRSGNSGGSSDGQCNQTNRS